MITAKTKEYAGIVFAIAILMALGGYLFWKNNIGTINVPKGEGAKNKVENLAGFTLPPGFSMNIFADDVPGARVLVLDPKGRIVVSQTEEGKITLLEDTDSDGSRDVEKVLVSGLSKPHGLAFDCPAEISEKSGCFLYVALKDKLVRYGYDAEKGETGEEEKLMDIASNPTDRHFTRSLLFPSPNENILLVSAGSSCDVCHEEDTDYASVMSYNVVTKEKGEFAKGLRNATFMALDPVRGKVFATEMGRDNLGDELPPDEINIIEKGDPSTGLGIKNYGWPVCYGKNIHDDTFDPVKKQTSDGADENMCASYTPSFIDLPAHSAPLGLAFIPEEGWPEEYWYDILVAYHGSWNRTTPTGYKIVRLKMNGKGEYQGTEDFITGWLTDGGEKMGRPVDIVTLPGGTAYITDDTAGVIYRISRTE